MFDYDDYGDSVGSGYDDDEYEVDSDIDKVAEVLGVELVDPVKASLDGVEKRINAAYGGKYSCLIDVTCDKNVSRSGDNSEGRLNL